MVIFLLKYKQSEATYRPVVSFGKDETFNVVWAECWLLNCHTLHVNEGHAQADESFASIAGQEHNLNNINIVGICTR